MGNRGSKNGKSLATDKALEEKSRKELEKSFPFQVQQTPTAWYFGEKEKKSLLQVLKQHQLQDLIEIFISLLSETEPPLISFYRTRSRLFDLDKNGNLRTDFYICPEWLKQKGRIKITLLGHWKGKTSLAIRFICRRFEAEYDPTIEDSFVKVIALNKECRCSIDVLDTAGQEEFSSMQDQWIRESDCVFISYNVCGPYSPEDDLTSNLEKVISRGEKMAIVVGTKTDLRKDFALYEKNFKEALSICERYNVSYIETSSLDDINIDFLFHYAVLNFGSIL